MLVCYVSPSFAYEAVISLFHFNMNPINTYYMSYQIDIWGILDFLYNQFHNTIVIDSAINTAV